MEINGGGALARIEGFSSWRLSVPKQELIFNASMHYALCKGWCQSKLGSTRPEESIQIYYTYSIWPCFRICTLVLFWSTLLTERFSMGATVPWFFCAAEFSEYVYHGSWPGLGLGDNRLEKIFDEYTKWCGENRAPAKNNASCKLCTKNVY